MLNGWTVPVQQASFKGVTFDVLAVSDEFHRDIAKHAYPFVNGEDLEDMGLQARTVQLQALFFGQGYYIELQRFLRMVQTQGEDVLVHPILGRLPNMLLSAASLRHDAENVNYAMLDLTFIESRRLAPVFQVDAGLVSQFDRWFNQLEQFLSKGAEFYRQLMLAVAQSHHQRHRLMRMWLSLNAAYYELVNLFKLDKRKYRHLSHLPGGNVAAHITRTINELTDIIREGLTQRANMPSMTVQAHFNEMCRSVDEVMQVMAQLPQRNVKRAKKEADLVALGTNLTRADMAELQALVHIITACVLCEQGGEVLEAEYQNMPPHEIDELCRRLRQALQESIQAVRVLQQTTNQPAMNIGREVQGEDAYQRYQLIEDIRNLAHLISEMSLKAINQKPPLSVRVCELNGTLHQVAHAFYGDWRRAAELLRLNPQIRNPNFIRQGELINAYSE